MRGMNAMVMMVVGITIGAAIYNKYFEGRV